MIEDIKCTIINEYIVSKFEIGAYVSRNEVYKNSVQVSASLIKVLKIEEISGFTNFHKLAINHYDPALLGYWKDYSFEESVSSV